MKEPSPEFLLSCSTLTLETLELSRLNAHRNLMKELMALHERAVEELAMANLLRFLLDILPELRRQAALDARQRMLDFECNEASEVAPTPCRVIGLPGNPDHMASLTNRKSVI